MTVVEQEILSTPAILRQTLARVQELMGPQHAGRGGTDGTRLAGAASTPQLLPRGGPLAFIGCGSSYCVGLAAASLYEATTGLPAQATMASEYLPRGDWWHIAISRTGQTSELIDAMGRARGAGGRVALICGALDAPAEAEADTTLSLAFAAERSIIQTRFIAAATIALRALIGGDDVLAPLLVLPEAMEVALSRFDPEPLSRFRQVVYLGRGWRYGLAQVAALNLQETALLPPNGFQTLEYRHGPVACADADTLVWCFDPPADPLSRSVLDDVRRTGATVRCTEDDPLIAVAQAQLVALRRAASRGIDPDAPRNLNRAVVFAMSDS